MIIFSLLSTNSSRICLFSSFSGSSFLLVFQIMLHSSVINHATKRPEPFLVFLVMLPAMFSCVYNFKYFLIHFLLCPSDFVVLPKKNHFSATCSFCLSPVHAGFSLHLTEKQLHRNTFTFLCLTLGSACHRTAKIVNRLTNLISSFITVTHPAVSLTSPPYSCVVIMHTGCLYCRHQGCCSCSRPNRTRFIPSYLPFILAAV